MKTDRCRFTLLEVIVSLAILAVSLASLLQIMTHSQAKIAKAEQRWKNMHMLMQGAEYVLLHDSGVSSVPYRFFPYSDYSIEITYEDIENLPEDYNEVDNQLDIQACKIQLVNLNGSYVEDQVIVDRIIYNDAYSAEE